MLHDMVAPAAAHLGNSKLKNQFCVVKGQKAQERSVGRTLLKLVLRKREHGERGHSKVGRHAKCNLG